MPKQKSHAFLRREAGPVLPSTLHKTAKQVLDGIIQALHSAAESAARPRKLGDELHIDMNRSSQIFFVSGEPGSGKTTLYLTLKAMLSSRAEYSDYREGYEIAALEEPKVRWLEPIDLEVSGDEGENLLAAVLVRLVRKLGESSSGFSKSCTDAIKKLDELAADIGMAWDGNLEERASALDPDTFSMEVMRAQRARLGVNERLREALDELANNNCCGCNSSTLFVLPVDDLYLKPSASLQLLRLLRMIYVPRLFFLVMGDITTVEALFVEKALADWTAVAGAEVFKARPERLQEALARARELRARFLRKLLPPGQRAVIEVMEWDEALRFDPEGIGEHPDDNGDTTLKKLLDGVSLDQPDGSAEMSLLRFLISPPFRKGIQSKAKNPSGDKTSNIESKTSRDELEKQAKKAREAYTALQILDATPREVTDLWSGLNKLILAKKAREKSQKTHDAVGPFLLLSIIGFVQLVIEEQNFLNEQGQESLRVVLPTRHYSPRDIQFEMDRLSLGSDRGPWTEKIEETLWVRKHRSWKLTVKGRTKDEGEEPYANLLPPRPTAWIVLLHDLAWKWRKDSVTANLVRGVCGNLMKWTCELSRSDSSKDAITKNAKQNRFIVKVREHGDRDIDTEFDPSVHFHGWAVWLNGSTCEHFPMPMFEAFRELDRFLFVWTSGLDWLDRLREQAEVAQKFAEDAKQLADLARAESANSESQIAGQEKKIDVEEQSEPSQQAQVPVFAEEAQLRSAAERAQKQVGIDEPERIRKMVHLWRLAGLTVDDSSYGEFAIRTDGWFEAQLEKSKDLSVIDKKDGGWWQEMAKFEELVLTTLKTPTLNQESGSTRKPKV
jgi:hypothetical protein